MPAASALAVCVAAAGVFQILLKTWVLSIFLVLGPTGNCPMVTSPLDPGLFFLIFSFFSPQTCSRGSAT